MIRKKIFFASDTHFGFPDISKSIIREKLFVKWLDEIKPETEELYLLGDIFDFWFEYRKVVPRGYTRLLGKLAEFSDSGIPVHFFCGNHDIWITNYLPSETGVILHREPAEIELSGKKFYMAHGDGLGPYDKKFKILKKVFTNKFAHWLFAVSHPNLGIYIAQKLSRHSRNSHGEVRYKGPDKEWLVLYSKNLIQKKNFDYLIFGHRHYPIDLTLKKNCRFISLGDWISNFTYGVFDGKDFQLKSYIDPYKKFSSLIKEK